MLLIDKNEFIAWTEGVYLTRHENQFTLVNKEKMELVKQALDAGEPVGLTDGSLIVGEVRKPQD